LQLVESGEFEGGFGAFYPHYLNPASDFSIITPTWNHLWYVVYLLPYTLILLAIAGPVTRFMRGQGARLTKRVFGGRFGPLRALGLPVLPHILIRLTLDPHFPTTHNFVWDWANHAHSFTMVLTGFLLAKDAAFWGAIRRALPAALALSIGLGAVLTALWTNWETLQATGDWDWVIWPARMARIIYAWTVIAALLGLAQRYLNRPSRALTYMTEAIFPWYILHQTLIVMAGFWLTRQGLDAWSEFALVVIATVGGCALLHECFIRRVGWLRPWFGLKPVSHQAAPLQPLAAK
ncbi:MAG: acyltransferase family protein, partial [Henriciella sp.]|uniref:acyltransferase family protein n=1 Tax=Henriciella sp. TaxID=1968823 RepID=UPI003C71783F